MKFSFSETVWDKPHNWWLEVADSAGSLGLLSYLAIFGAAAWYLVKQNSHESRQQILGRIILLATIVAYAVQSLFLFETSNSLLLFFFILACISSTYTSAALQSPIVGSSIIAVQRRLTWICYPVFLILAIIIWKYNVLPLQASYNLSQAHAALDSERWAKHAEHTLAVPVSFAMENGIFLAEHFVQLDKANISITSELVVTAAKKVAKNLEQEAALNPLNPTPLVWAGQIYLILGEKVDPRYYAVAEQMLLGAQALSPHKQEFLFLLGRLYLLTKDFSKAIAVQQQAVAAAPYINTSHWFLGLTDVASGERTKGLAEIEQALSLGYQPTLPQQLYIIDLYTQEQKYDTVIEWYKKLLVTDPENIGWQVKLATAYALIGNKPAALRTVEHALQLFPPLRPEAEKFIKQFKLK